MCVCDFAASPALVPRFAVVEPLTPVLPVGPSTPSSSDRFQTFKMVQLTACYTEYASKPGMMTTKDLTQLFTHAKLMKKTGDWSSNSIDIRFSKHKTKGKNFLTQAEFTKFMKDIAGDGFDAIAEKLDGTKKADHIKTKVSATGGVDRMTDASKYTGSHKERFDESGKGKGAEGRTDPVDATGYVGAYKGEGTHGKK